VTRKEQSHQALKTKRMKFHKVMLWKKAGDMVTAGPKRYALIVFPVCPLGWGGWYASVRPDGMHYILRNVYNV
jgi:hypothetical protein